MVSGISIAQGNGFVIQLVVEIFRKAEMGISAVVSSDDVRYNDYTMDIAFKVDYMRDLVKAMETMETE